MDLVLNNLKSWYAIKQRNQNGHVNLYTTLVWDSEFVILNDEVGYFKFNVKDESYLF